MNRCYCFIPIFALVACGATGPNITYDAGMSEEDQKLAEAAIEALKQTCPNIKKYWTQFDKAPIDIYRMTESNLEYYRIYPEVAPHQYTDFGWKYWVQFTPVIAKNARYLPEQARAYRPYPTGVTLHYYLGGGKRPGIRMMKNISRYMCSDVLGDGPAVSFVDDKRFQFIQPE